MNTLTSQEINTMPVTNEEEEAMQQLTSNQVQEVCTITTTQPEVTIEMVINSICSHLQLLGTVIKQTQGNSLAEQQSLQDCVTTVLQQGSWFNEKVAKAIDDADIEDIVKDAVHEEVTSIVESYFNYEFQLSDHVDVDDMVREQVQEKFENIKISFD
jgi:hypothetical protein